MEIDKIASEEGRGVDKRLQGVVKKTSKAGTKQNSEVGKKDKLIEVLANNIFQDFQKQLNKDYPAFTELLKKQEQKKIYADLRTKLHAILDKKEKACEKRIGVECSGDCIDECKFFVEIETIRKLCKDLTGCDEHD